MAKAIINPATDAMRLGMTKEQRKANKTLVTKSEQMDLEKIKKGFRWMVGPVQGKRTKTLVSPANFSKKIDLGFEFV